MRTFKNRFHEWDFKTIYITDDTEAAEIVGKLAADTKTLYGLDIETGKIGEYEQSGLCPHISRIRLVQVYAPQHNISYVFDVYKVRLEVLAPMCRACRFVAHNGIFEIKHLTHAGYPDMNIGCSMLISQLIVGAEHSPYEKDEDDDDEDKTGLSQYTRFGHSLDYVVQRLFGVKVDKAFQTSNWDAEELVVDQITYAGLDAILTYKIATAMSPKIAEYKMVKVYQLLKDMQHVVAHMELVGLPVDWEYHANLIKGWESKSREAFDRCTPFFGNVNMRSGKQMNEWLIGYLKDKPELLEEWPKTDKGAYTFTKTAIAAYKELPAIGALLEYKKYAKLIDTYGQSLIEKKHPITGRLHTSYTLGETRTGRLSSRNPNCQNYPRDKEFRDMFIAQPGHVIVVSDFSQIELRLQSEFSKDPQMRKVYKEKQDIYKTMASVVYGLPTDKIDKAKRFVGKTIMLALGYGMGAKKLNHYAVNAGVHQQQEFWDAAWKTYHNTFTTYSQWCDSVRRRAKGLGYIDTLLGKRRKLSQDEMYTRAPNTVIQGSAAELMMTAMLLCYAKVRSYGQLVATVHDEILLHVPEDRAEEATEHLASAMNDAMKQMFPNAASHEVADAAAGKRWGEVKAEL